MLCSNFERSRPLDDSFFGSLGMAAVFPVVHVRDKHFVTGNVAVQMYRSTVHGNVMLRYHRTAWGQLVEIFC